MVFNKRQNSPGPSLSSRRKWHGRGNPSMTRAAHTAPCEASTLGATAVVGNPGNLATVRESESHRHLHRVLAQTEGSMHPCLPLRSGPWGPGLVCLWEAKVWPGGGSGGHHSWRPMKSSFAPTLLGSQLGCVWEGPGAAAGRGHLPVAVHWGPSPAQMALGTRCTHDSFVGVPRAGGGSLEASGPAPAAIPARC